MPLSTRIGDAIAAIRDKLNALTNSVNTKVVGVSGTAPIVSTGGTSPAISISAATTTAAGSMSAADKVKLNGITRAIGFDCIGKMVDGELIARPIATATYTLTVSNSKATAETAATSSTVVTVKKNGAQVGTITFAAGSTTGTISLTNTSVTAGDVFTFWAPATADATLADVSALLRE